MAYKKCIECGMCRTACPVFQVLQRETVSPRGKVKIMKEGIKNEISYACTLCMKCTVACPLGLKLCQDFVKHRIKIVNSGIETKSNQEMIKNVKKDGTPMGELEEGKKPSKLYCC